MVNVVGRIIRSKALEAMVQNRQRSQINGLGEAACDIHLFTVISFTHLDFCSQEEKNS